MNGTRLTVLETKFDDLTETERKIFAKKFTDQSFAHTADADRSQDSFVQK